MNTKIYYLYRDASNYKTQNEVVVEGEFTQEDVDAILGTLSDGEWFVPEMVGFDCDRFSDWDDQDDHYYCELDEDCFELTDEPATLLEDGSQLRSITIGEVVARFEAAEDDGWIYIPDGEW